MAAIYELAESLRTKKEGEAMTYWICRLYDEKYNPLCSAEFGSLEGAKKSVNLENKEIRYAVIVGSNNGEIHKYRNDRTTLTEVFE